MPRILRIINRLNLGGPTYNAAYLSAGLSTHYETLLVAGMKDDSEESSEYIVHQLGLEPLYITNMKREVNFFNDIKAYRQIRKIIKSFNPDIVHTHAAKSGALGRLAALHEGVPVIVHTFHGHVFHNYFGNIKSRIFIEIERYLAERSTAIIAISELQRTELVEKYKISSLEKTKVIPLGFDLQRFRTNQQELRKSFRSAYGISDNTVAIGIIGRLVPIKNHRMFIKGIKKLQQSTSCSFHAFIIGDGEERKQLEEFCRDEEITFNKINEPAVSANVTFTSWIKNVEWALAGLDLVALTSFNEGTPVSLIEAQAAGKPIISTETGGIRDVVLPDETAFLVPSGDVDAFAQKLKLLVESDDLRNSFSVKGWSFVEERFHHTRLVSDFKKLYDQLLLTKAAV